MRIQPKSYLETLKIPNFVTVKKKDVIATGLDFKTPVIAFSHRLKGPFQEELIRNLRSTYLVQINYPLVLCYDKNRHIIINIKPLHIDTISKLNTSTLVACILAGSAFRKLLYFNESVVIDYLFALMIRVFGKQFGLLVPEKKDQLKRIISEYVATWRKESQFEIFLNELKQIMPVNRNFFLARLLAYLRLEAIPTVEDYYRLVQSVVGAVIPNKVFGRQLIDVNKSVANQIVNIWAHAKDI